MNKNKGEETVHKIVEVAGRLFVEKGYEQTSVQDILTEVGLSKGAIYHHFKSKQDILNRVLEEQFKMNSNSLEQFVNESCKESYSEKIKEAFEKLASHSYNRDLEKSITKTDDPHFIVDGLKRTVNEAAPIVAKFINRGIEDNSFNTKYPDEAAEVLMLLMNIWLNTKIFKRSKEESVKRLYFLKELMNSIGVDVISDEMLNNITLIYDEFNS